jgi:hypothetical protein
MIIQDEVKDLNAHSLNSVSNFTSQLDESRAQTENLKLQLDNLRIAHADELRRITLQHSEDLSRERDIHFNEREIERRKLEERLKETEYRLEEKVRVSSTCNAFDNIY